MRVESQTPLPSNRELTALTIPQMGLMACHLCISLTDMWVAGQIDAATLSALGVVSQIFSLLMLLTSLVGSGCMATVSQAVGGGKHLRASRYAALVLGCCLALGCVVAVLALFCLPVLLHWLVQDAALRAIVRIFAVAYCCHLPFFFGMIMMNSLFRAHKMVWLPLATLALVAAINYVGSVGFGLGQWGLPKLGYAGVAWATVASGLAGFICNVKLIIRKHIVHRESLAPWRWARVALPRLWRIGIPAALGHMAGHVGSLALLACLSSLPHAVDAVAGMTLGLRVLGVLLFPVAGLGFTLTICSGHLLGARQAESAYRLGLRLAWCTGIFLSICATALYARHAQVARWFSTDAATLHEAGLFLLFGCISLPLQGVGQMLHAVFAGAGCTRLSSLTSCAGMWLVAVPLAFVLGQGLNLGAQGVYIAMALGHMVTALWTWRLYRQQKWLNTFV